MKRLLFIMMLVIGVTGIITAQEDTTDDTQGAMMPVIVDLNMMTLPETNFTTTNAIITQRAAIRIMQSQFTNSLSASGIKFEINHRYVTSSTVAMHVPANAIAELEANPLVHRVYEDRLAKVTMDESNQIVGAPAAWANGFDGTGHAVAVFDTGVDFTHPSLINQRLDELCYSTTNINFSSVTACPNGQDTQFGGNAARPYNYVNNNCIGCDHGTHVAGTVAGNGTGQGGSHENFRGVAPGAELIGVQVFSIFNDPGFCGSSNPCTASYTSDQMAALEGIYLRRNSYAVPIVAINMSLGGGQYFSESECEAGEPASYTTLVSQLRDVGIAVIAASGNDYFKNSMGAPACLPNIVSVGATADFNGTDFEFNEPIFVDSVVSFSNSDSNLDLVAPGARINSTIPFNQYDNFQGTSMATPHVAGAWAIMREAYPGESVNQILTRLRNTGQPTVDDGFYATGLCLLTFYGENCKSPNSAGGVPYSYTFRRIDIEAATVDAVPTEGVISFVSSSSTGDEGTTATITAQVVVTEAPPNLNTFNVLMTYSGSAQMGTDFTAPDIVAFNRSGGYDNGTYTASFTVNLLNDAVIDDNETLTITLNDPSPEYLSLGAQTTHTITINDTNVQATGSLQFSQATSTVASADSTATVNLRLSVVDGPPGVTPFNISLSYGGTAVRNVAYSAPSSVNTAQSFNVGTYEVPITINLLDNLATTETITLTISGENSPHMSISGQTTHTITILPIMVTEITENHLTDALNAIIAESPSITTIDFVLVDLVATGANLTVRLDDGTIATTTMSISSSGGIVSFGFGQILVNGTPSNIDVSTRVNNELGEIFTPALNRVLDERMGPNRGNIYAFDLGVNVISAAFYIEEVP